jgi:hypothetical protein
MQFQITLDYRYDWGFWGRDVIDGVLRWFRFGHRGFHQISWSRPASMTSVMGIRVPRVEPGPIETVSFSGDCGPVQRVLSVLDSMGAFPPGPMPVQARSDAWAISTALMSEVRPIRA